jgi:protein TonB
VTGRAGESRLSGPLGISVLLHVSVVAAVAWTFRPGPPVVLPPVYRVQLRAAPAGERAIGEVNAPTPAPNKPVDAAPKTREVAPPAPAAPVKKATPAPAKATPTTSTAKPKPGTAAPKAGGGPTGGRGSDVANVDLQGIDFPYPGYLNNIVRQIALNFKPSNPNAPLRADVAFIIQRDGTVKGFRFVNRSGVYAFDLAAQGAIEKAKQSFGPLPAGFRDDALPVVFSFDPKIFR